MAPDEHFQDIKRAIAATSGHTSKINVIMPLLYQSRQDKRKGQESLDCSKYIAKIIITLNKRESTEDLYNGKKKIIDKIKKKKELEEKQLHLDI